MKVCLKRLGVTLAAVLTATATAGCGDDSFEEIEELRDAYVDAGGECDEFEKDQEPGTGNETGNCAHAAVILFVYSDEDQFQSAVESLHADAAENDSTIRGESAITGPNWMILNTDDAEVAEALDGRVETFRGY